MYKSATEHKGKIYERTMAGEFKIAKKLPNPVKLGFKVDQPTSLKSIYGENVDFELFDDVRDIKRVGYEYKGKVYGMTNPLNGYLSKYTPSELEESISGIDSMVIMGIDIETFYDTDKKFKDETLEEKIEKYPILTIACCLIVNGVEKSFCIGTRPASDYQGSYKYIEVATENDMFEKFAASIHYYKVDTLVGYNSVDFDYPYILGRGKTIGFDVNKLSPFYTKAPKNTNLTLLSIGYFTKIKIVGINLMDMLQIVKKLDYTNYSSDKLDYVSEQILGVKKVSYDEYSSLIDLYERNFTKFVDYNIRDAVLVIKLHEKTGLLKTALATSIMYGIEIDRCWDSAIEQWDAYLWRYIEEIGYIIPPQKDVPDGEYKGGYVKQTIPGYHKAIASVDFKSLYPSIVISANISPETYTRTDNGNCVKSPIEGVYFTKDERGLMPTAMDRLLNQRDEVKKEMKALEAEMVGSYDKDMELRLNALNNKNLVIKNQANNGYGVMGNNKFRYFNLDIAKSITAFGRTINKIFMYNINEFIDRLANSQSVENTINHHNAPVDLSDDEVSADYCDKNLDNIIAGDTDSSYITLQRVVNTKTSDSEMVKSMDDFMESVLVPLFKSWSVDIAEDYNFYDNRIKLKREVLGAKGIFRGKKNYVIVIFDSEGVKYPDGKMKVIGLESVKSSFPKAVRSELEKCYRMALDEPHKLDSHIKKTFKPLFMNELDVFNIAASQTVRMKEGGNTPAINGVNLHNSLSDSSNQIKSGSQVFWLYLKEPNIYGYETIAFTSEGLPRNFDMDTIDRLKMFNKLFLNPINTIALHAGVDLIKKTNRLNGLMGKMNKRQSKGV